MSLETSSVEHIFNVMRRHIVNDIPNLKLIYVLYDDHEQAEALQSKKHEILEHPAGQRLVTILERELEQGVKNKSFFGGLVYSQTSSMLGLKKHKEYLAVSFISLSELSFYDDEEFACRHTALTLAWPALYLWHSQQSDPKSVKDADGWITKTTSKAETLRQSLMADAFSAMYMEMLGYKGGMQQVTKARCEYAIAKAMHYTPEEHPLPIGIDGLNLVFKDLKADIPADTTTTDHVINMAIEVGQTYDDNSFRQWVLFCRAAQEMAWMDHSKNDILSAAVYSSENAYIRATGHMMAETLNTTPVPMKNAGTYNPFAEGEVNERLHTRLCRLAFINTLEKIVSSDDASLFLEKAKEQSRRFLLGFPIGWCATALIEAENAYHMFKETPSAEEQDITDAFQAAFLQIKWQDIRELNRKFISVKRQGHEITPALAYELIEKNKELAPFQTAFALIRYEKLPEKKPSHEETEETAFILELEEAASKAS